MHIVSRTPAAVAYIKGSKEAPMLSGVVRFFQYPGGVLVEADLSGLPKNTEGFYGFHIHEGGACNEDSFSSASSHYNPAVSPHPRHAGDLPPLLAYGDRAYLAVMTNRFSLPEVFGRTVVIHGMPDDFHTQPAGNAGGRIGCGTIGPVVKITRK